MTGFSTTDPKVRVLRSVRLFAGSSRRQLAALAGQMDEIVVSAGSVLVRQGRPGHSFYVIVAGTAAAEIDGIQVAAFGPGDFFGEISMIDRDPAVATVTAGDECTLMVLSHEQFRRAMQGDPDLEVTVTRAMVDRLEQNELAGLSRR